MDGRHHLAMEQSVTLRIRGVSCSVCATDQPQPHHQMHRCQQGNEIAVVLDAERQKQLRLVADLTANSVSASQIDSITGYLDDWESVSFDDKRNVVDILISQIDATSESVTIHWKI